MDELTIKVAILRRQRGSLASLKSRILNHIKKLSRIPRMAEALGQDFIDMLPSSWRFKIVASAGDIPETDLLNTSAYPGRILSYRHLMVASICVGGYTLQLFLSGLSISCAAWPSRPADYRITPEYIAVCKFLSEIIDDIAASIRFFLGWKPEIVPMKLESARLSRETPYRVKGSLDSLPYSLFVQRQPRISYLNHNGYGF